MSSSSGRCRGGGGCGGGPGGSAPRGAGGLRGGGSFARGAGGARLRGPAPGTGIAPRPVVQLCAGLRLRAVVAGDSGAARTARPGLAYVHGDPIARGVRLVLRRSGVHQVDVTALLPEVKVPTLVLHRRQVPNPVVDLARDLAARIPDARLVVLEGTTVVPWRDMEPVLEAITAFLGEGG